MVREYLAQSRPRRRNQKRMAHAKERAMTETEFGHPGFMTRFVVRCASSWFPKHPKPKTAPMRFRNLDTRVCDQAARRERTSPPPRSADRFRRFVA